MFCYFFVIDVKTMHFSFRSFIIITFSKVGYFTDVIFSTRIVLTTILERKRADMASDVHHASIYVYIMAQRKQESSARFSLVRLHMTASWVSRRGIRRRAVGFIRLTSSVKRVSGREAYIRRLSRRLARSRLCSYMS